MRDAAHHYNRPPDLPPFDIMWENIERRLNATRAIDGMHSITFRSERRSFLNQPWVRMAAMLVLGVGLGRFVLAPGHDRAAPQNEVAQEQVGRIPDVPSEYQVVTDHYLGQTAALLIALPAELSSRRADSTFLARADDLLLQTRMLLDSPAASDPGLHTLFEDLELVLAQVVRLQGDRDQTRIELLRQALEQGDVIPRLRSAVADHIAD
jgi:hypothetical protein